MGMKMAGLASPTSSWFNAVKNAFRSSKKQNNGCGNNKKKSEKRREKKREKRTWLFSKSVTKLDAEQRHAIAVAAATAEAAAATAQAAIEIVRLSSSSTFLKEMKAIVIIQTSFRGFLARKALRALKGLVKLQALVRGQNVRNQAKITLQYIQALVRAQDQLRPRLSLEGGRRPSMFAETNNSSRPTTVSRGGSGYCDERSRTLDEIDKMLQTRREALMKREKALANALSQQNVSSKNKSQINHQRAYWLERWMASKLSRASTDARNKYSVETAEVDAFRPQPFSNSHMARSLQQRQVSPQRLASPRRSLHDISSNHQSPATPSTTPIIRPLQVRSASPRYFNYSTTHTPNFGSTYRLMANKLDEDYRIPNDVTVLPNYMTTTESAKAKSRSQSAPRTRPPTPERERSESVKKRLSYQPEEHIARASFTSMPGGTSQDMRSPRVKSFHEFSHELEQQSNLFSYYTDSLAGEISPCSTTDLQSWLR